MDPATLTDTALLAAGRQAVRQGNVEYLGAVRREISYRNRVQRETGKRPRRIT